MQNLTHYKFKQCFNWTIFLSLKVETITTKYNYWMNRLTDSQLLPYVGEEKWYKNFHYLSYFRNLANIATIFNQNGIKNL